MCTRHPISSGKVLGVHHESRTCVKFSLLDPETTKRDIDDLFDALLRIGLAVQSEVCVAVTTRW